MFIQTFKRGHNKKWFRTIVVIVLGYFIVQLALCLLYDASNPQAFLKGDRSENRMVNVRSILQAESWKDFINAILFNGLPGDYLWQAIIFRLFHKAIDARLAVILMQILLCAISIFYVALIADALTKNKRIVIFATLFYSVLPHNLVFPHWLVSEAFFVPFVIIASYYSISYFNSDTRRGSVLLIALLWAVCGLTRPNALLFPLFLFILYQARMPSRCVSHIIFLSLYILLISFWIIPSYCLTGNPNISAGYPKMFNRTLYSKADYLITALPAGAQQREHEWLRKISETEFAPSQLFALYFRHPDRAALTTVIESAKMLLKLDETNFLAYFSGWKAEREWGKQLLTDFPSLIKREPLAASIVTLGAFVWIVPLILSFFGCIRCLQAKNFVAQLLLVHAIYFLASALLGVDYAQGRHRYPVDFVIVIFAMSEVFHRISRKKFGTGQG